MRYLVWHPKAWAEYQEFQADKTMLKRVNRLLQDIMRNGYQTSYGRVEMLKGDFRGFGSVRIDKKNRIVFQTDEKQVIVIQCGGHYHDH